MKTKRLHELMLACLDMVARRTVVLTLLAAGLAMRASGVSIHTVDSGSGGDTGSFISGALIAGKPAVSYYDRITRSVMFARNSATDGSGVWVVYVAAVFTNGDDYARATSLAELDGKPAIAYSTYLSGLRLARCSTASGSGAWSNTMVSAAGGTYCSMAVVGGLPAIAFEGSGGLKYALNSATNGLGGWTTNTVDATSGAGDYCSLTVVGGFPSIGYYDNASDDLKFARNSASNGLGSWAVVTVSTNGDVGQYASLADVGGFPAMTYLARPNAWMYARATNAAGTGSWTSFILETDIGVEGSLAMVNGRPAVSYGTSGSRGLKYAWSTATNGLGGWTNVVVEYTGSAGRSSLFTLSGGNPCIGYLKMDGRDAKFAVNAQVDGAGIWVTALVDAGTGGDVGSVLSQAVVEGAPAVAYYDALNGDLKFARNSSANGLGVWTISTVDSDASGGQISLAIVDGYPAMVLVKSNALWFARNAETDGSGDWTVTPVPGSDYGGYDPSLAVVAGYPCIAFGTYDAGLHFSRNSARDGSGTWTTIRVGTTGYASGLGNTHNSSLAEVDGNPAICFYESITSSVRYVRSPSPEGTGTWSSVTIYATEDSGKNCRMAVIDGKPSVVFTYKDDAPLDCYVRYARSSTTNGLSSWNVNTVDNPTDLIGEYTDLAIVNFRGVPAVSYYDDTSNNFMVAIASTPDGGWSEETWDSAGDVGSASSLAVVNGKLAAAYYDSDNTALKWAIQDEPPSSPDISVQLFSGRMLADGDTFDYGPAQVGETNGQKFVILNDGVANLTGVVATISGADTSSFVMVSTPASTVTPGTSSPFRIRFIPTNTGVKTVLLQITSNDTNESPYRITLTGEGAVPDISIEKTGGVVVPDGGSFTLSSTTAGAVTSSVFTLRNAGDDDLIITAAGIVGPNASQFSLMAGYTPVLPPGGSTNFSIQFAPDSYGTKTGELRVASNDPDESPYSITLYGLGLAPEIQVELPGGTNVDSGSIVDFGGAMVAGQSVSKTFTIYNIGNRTMTGLAVTISGVGAANFSVNDQPPTTMSGPYGSGTFGITFDPTSAGFKAALLEIAGNDPDENPFQLALTGNGNLSGNVDPDFTNTVDGPVYAIAVQPDGKTIIAGAFTNVNGQTRHRIARFLADGTLEDTNTFSTGSGPNGAVLCVAVQNDGRIVIGGQFTSVDTQACGRIARLLSDGSVEGPAGFNPGSGANSAVLSLSIDASDRIIAGGTFVTINGQSRGRIARLLSDGSLESTNTFSPGSGAGALVYSVATQPDGKILVAGDFSTFDGQSRGRIARLLTNGALESTATFNPGTGASDLVRCIAVQPDQKILVAGDFTNVAGVARARIARLHSDGSVEGLGTFNTGGGADSNVFAVALQADGRIVLAGDFTAVGGLPRPRVARLNANGSVQALSTFDTGNGASQTVACVAIAADGGILIGGTFTNFDGQTRNGFARLLNAEATDSLDLSSRLAVRWLRSGTAPEVDPVTFEISTNNGATWAAPVVATRSSNGWEKTGVLLPFTGTIRARGQTPANRGATGAGIVETVASYNLTPDIAVLNLANSAYLYDGSFVASAAGARIGTTTNVLSFRISNAGQGELTGLSAYLGGPNASQFSIVSGSLPSNLAPGSNTTITIALTPTGGSGSRSAILHILSDSPGESPFDVSISATAYSPVTDTDGDGMNDWAEYELAAFGFAYNSYQPQSVSTYFSTAPDNSLYTTGQLQALSMDGLIIARDPLTSQFLVTIGMEKATNLMSTFTPFPMTSTQTVINGQGKLEFRFSTTNPATIYRLKSE